jgi:hypothetical protein
VWTVLDFSDAVAENPEPSGVRSKVWLQRGNGERWLFKGERADSSEIVAEVIASVVARRLGLPHVAYRLATYQGSRGCACKMVEGLNHGQLLLAAGEQDGSDIRYKNFQHSVDAVSEALQTLGAPRPTDGVEILPHCAQMDALGVYTGYLLLDAWIANTDRHAENWGYVETASGGRRSLAPSYDHGSAFSWRENDDTLRKRMDTQDKGFVISHFLDNAKSALYGDTRGPGHKTLGTITAFRAFAALAPDAAQKWMYAMVRAQQEGFITELVEGIPTDLLSPIRRKWLQAVLEHNACALRRSARAKHHQVP